MEFGPRALGNRSILSDPRNPKMRDIINTKIKLREKFRPFASVLDTHKEAGLCLMEILILCLLLRMLKKKKILIPAVTHIDGTGRLQTVKKFI